MGVAYFPSLIAGISGILIEFRPFELGFVILQ